MFVVATAGHVDHGKSTLVRALTGMEPDRWAEERRRGMTIDLGFAWAPLPTGETVAFVDVPGHERFVGNMLAGVGPVPAVLFVVAADEGWMPQSAEHLDALHALGVHYGLIAVTRSDLADPGPAMDRAVAELGASALGLAGRPEAVAVSGSTGAGLDGLRAALGRLVRRLPVPDPAAPVRLWVDRAFTIRGSGTVVTGTLPAGRIRTGDELWLAPGGRPATVRALQSLGQGQAEVTGTARVAVNLRGVRVADVGRGMALISPGSWLEADEIDVRLAPPRPPGPAANGGRPVPPEAPLPREITLHIGSAAVPARVRPLGTDTVRLRLDRPLPLRIGDRALLRDPGRRQVAAGLTVLDVRPPALARRGAATVRAAELSTMDGQPDGAGELRRRGLIRVGELRAMGAEPPIPAVAGDWLVDPPRWAAWRRSLADLVGTHATAHPLDHGVPVEAARQRLGLPDPRLVTALATGKLTVRDGRVVLAGAAPVVPEPVRSAVDAVRGDLAVAPFVAPEAHRLTELGLGPRELAAAVRAGALLRVAAGVYLLPGAEAAATAALRHLPQPFTLSEARQALHTTRRVAVPLLELLDARGVTERLPDSRRRLRELT
ncbi:MAG TPA: SelB C-terminal domain-containing protein [Mycobacteriales bacterium]|nr:SelB C-terminal domain-containing protein [Mycobacteriales bacterium]